MFKNIQTFCRFSHQKDTQAGTDTLHFNLQDTEGNVMMDQALSITVLEDKVPPRITLNVGLSLMEDASAPITADLLSAMDAEMDPMELVFMVRMLSVNVAYRFDKFV